VEGRMVSRSDSTFMLAVQDALTDRGTRMRWAGEVVELPEIYVGQVMERRLSKGRTGLLVAAVLAGAALVLTTDLAAVPGEDISTKPDPGNGAQTGVFEIPIQRMRLP